MPNREELDQIQSLDAELAQGEALLADLNKKSSKLRAKVQFVSVTSILFFYRLKSMLPMRCTNLGLIFMFYFTTGPRTSAQNGKCRRGGTEAKEGIGRQTPEGIAILATFHLLMFIHPVEMDIYWT